MQQAKRIEVKKLVILALLCAIAYLVMLVRIPIVLFLKYEAKDVIIAIGGFIYGPLSAVMISVVVSLLEMVSVSDTGYIGLIMNILSSCAFACTASFIYKRNHTARGAMLGLIAGTLLTTATMLLWNYLITPLYMPNTSRSDVAGMLVPIFLPFNLLKYGLNTAITMLLYKPVVTALRKARLIAAPASSGGTQKFSWSVPLISLAALAILIVLVLWFMGKI